MVGRLVESPPPCCPARHPWGPPVDGRTRLVVGHQPCRCRGGHRTYHCETADCPEPWVRVGWCANRRPWDPLMWTWDPDDPEHHAQRDEPLPDPGGSRPPTGA